MEQKLKSVVGDDHFRKQKIDKNKRSEAIQVRICLVRILSCSEIIPGCARTLHCCSGFQKWPREKAASLAEKVSMKQK